jgi:hypothetical protein
MDGSDIQLDCYKALVSLRILCSSISLLLPPLIWTWMAMLSAGSSLLEVLEVVEPDLERFIMSML